MSRRRLAFLLLIAVMVADYLILIFWGTARLAELAPGVTPLDLQGTGYGEAEAKAFVSGLGAEGGAFYRGPIAVLDTIFPVTCTLVLAIAIWHRSLGLATWLRGLGVGVALLYGALDLGENMLVHGLIRGGADAVTASAAATASAVTQAKFAVFFIALAALVALLIRKRPVGKK